VSSDFSCFSSVCGIELLGELICKDQILFANTDIPQFMQVFCRLQSQFWCLPRTPCVIGLIPAVIGFYFWPYKTLSVNIAVIYWVFLGVLWQKAIASDFWRTFLKGRELTIILIIFNVILFEMSYNAWIEGSSFVFSYFFGNCRETGCVLKNVVLSDGLVQTVNLYIIHPLIHLVLLYYFLLVLANREVDLDYLLIPPRIIEVRERVALLPWAHHSMGSWFIKPFRHFLHHIPNVDNKSSRLELNINPFIVNSLDLKSLACANKHSQKAVVTVFTQRLNSFIIFWHLRVMEDMHKTKMIFAQSFSEVSSLKAEWFCKGLH